ncbi:MAG: hypothetical protein E6J61_17195 [Deltaproteobacteria bacterium]|nr:MAG: hypothetical protein E6J61_17195 [Deltaproteobacteria bacterium]
MNRVFPLVLLLCAAACASSRNTNTFDVRASSSGRGRAFEFDRKQGELIAWSANGKLLQLWVHPGELDVGTSSRRTVEEGCRGGFLTRSDPEGSVVVEIHLCPLAVTRAQGWKTWHADYELHTEREMPGTLPPKSEFSISWDDQLRDLRIASPSMRASMSVPDADWAAPIRSYPEMLALAVLLGVVPFAPDGKYEVR